MNAMGHGVYQMTEGGPIGLPTGGKQQGCLVPRHELDHEGLEFRTEGEPQ